MRIHAHLSLPYVPILRAIILKGAVRGTGASAGGASEPYGKTKVAYQKKVCRE